MLKISDDELVWFTGKEDFDQAAEYMQTQYHIPLLLISMGKQGSRAYCGEQRAEIPAFLNPHTIETTGAGDTFMGCMLHQILDRGFRNLTKTDMEEMLQFANAAASLITTKRGALRVMPAKQEIKVYLSAFC